MMTTSANSLPVSNPFNNILKTNYKSTPIIKHINMILHNEESSGKKESTKENNYHSNFNKQILLPEMTTNNIISPTNKNKKLSATSAKNNVNILKNSNFNLWRKPVALGGGTQGPVYSEGNVKSGLKISNEKSHINIIDKRKSSLNTNHSNANNLTNTITNCLTTNYTDNKKEVEVTHESNYKNSSINNQSTPKNKDEIRFMTKKFKSNSPDKIKENYMTNKNVNINLNNNEIFNSEILSSIVNFKTLLKSNQTNNNIEKIFQNEENLNKINALNCRLHMYGGGVNIIPQDNQMNEFILFKKDTFENPQFKQPINVINSDMLLDHMNLKPKLNKENDIKKFEEKNKDKIMNEIVMNSDMRLKRYEILLDFINANLKEINQMVINTNQNNANNNLLSKTKSINFVDATKILEEVNSNKYSSLHSKINMNSRTNLNFEKEENFADESNFFNNNNNFILPINIRNESCVFSNIDFNEKEMNNFNQPYIESPSFLISSIHSELYQNFMEESFNNNNGNTNKNYFKEEMSSFRTPVEFNNRKLERMVSYESDKTPLQYLQYQNIVKDTVKAKKSADLNKLQPKYTEESIGGGEENLEESDLDKTKENLLVYDTKKIINNQVIKDMQRSNKNPKIETIFKNEIKQNLTPISKSPEEKSKCVIF